jgi:broad specificity phosphatase PhoE
VLTDQLKKQHFYYARHGQTDWNKRYLCQGQKDIPLNDEGIVEAKVLARICSGLNIECIISSPLKRALKTAQEVQFKLPNSVIYEMPNLSERNWGDR